MELSSHLQDQIDRYLRQELSGQELKDFQTQLQSNQKLSDAVHLQKEMVSQLKFIKKKAFVREIHQELLEEGELESEEEIPKGKTRKLSPWIWIPSIAAAIFLLILFIQQLPSSETEFHKLLDKELSLGSIGDPSRLLAADQEIPEYIKRSTTRSGDGKTLSPLDSFLIDSIGISPELIQDINSIKTTYHSADLQADPTSFLEVANGLENIIQTYDTSQYPLAFQLRMLDWQGQAFARANRYAEARKVYEHLWDRNQQLDRQRQLEPDRIEFFLGVMYFHEEGRDSQKGKEIFNRILASTHRYAEDVSRIMQAL